MNDTHLRRGLTSLEFGYHNIFIRPLQWLALFVVPAVFMACASIIGLISIYAPFSPTDTMSVGQVAAVVSLGLTGVIASVSGSSRRRGTWCRQWSTTAPEERPAPG